MVWIGLANAQTLDPFVGTWNLDASASDSLGPFLAAQGVSWPLRKLAETARPVLEVRESEGGLHISTISAKGTREDKVVPDGKVRESTSRTGPVSCASRWVGAALQTDCTTSTGAMSVVRRVEDDVWTQQITYTPTDGKPVVLNRVFRR